MRAEVILIYPPICPGHKPFYSMPPLGVTYLATLLRASGIEVRIIDAEHEGLSLEQTAQRAVEFNPRLIGISVMTPMFSSALEISKRIKFINKNIHICFGGPHISATLDESFRFAKDVDYLFFGESEVTFRAFIADRYSTTGAIDGFAYLKDGEIVSNPKMHYIEDLDTLPYPDFNLIDNFNIHSYKIPYSNRSAFLPIMASRGCYYNCTFCNVQCIHGRKLRLRSPENVFTEMQQRYLYQGARYFVFKDSSLTLNRKWIEDICSLLIDNKLPVNWRCNSRTDEVDERLLRIMRKAGCNLITYGIESGSQYILNRLQKNLTVKDNARALRQTHKAGIQTHSIYIIGSPGESIQSIKETIGFALKSNSLFVQFGRGIAYPRNGFYEWGIKSGALEDKLWYVNEKPLHRETFLINPHCGGGLNLPGIDQEYWIKKAVIQYYFRFRYICQLIYASVKNPYLVINALVSMVILVKWRLDKESMSKKSCKN